MIPIQFISEKSYFIFPSLFQFWTLAPFKRSSGYSTRNSGVTNMQRKNKHFQRHLWKLLKGDVPASKMWRPSWGYTWHLDSSNNQNLETAFLNLLIYVCIISNPVLNCNSLTTQFKTRFPFPSVFIKSWKNWIVHFLYNKLN